MNHLMCDAGMSWEGGEQWGGEDHPQPPLFGLEITIQCIYCSAT